MKRVPWVLVAAALMVTVPARAQVEPNPLIAPVVFHWAQVQTAWPTLEGGSVAAGSTRFWRRQLKLFETAGFTAQLFQVAYGDQTSQRNHLDAMRQMVAERGSGLPLPRIVPFFAAETFPEYLGPKDVLSPAGFEAFYLAMRTFFVMYAEYFPEPGRPGVPSTTLFAKVDGRVFIGLWWVPLADYQLPGTFFERLSDRLQADFGFRAYWSAHEAWANGNPDDINYLFNGAAPLQRGKNPAHPAVDLLVAFWPPDLVNYQREYFVPRAAGLTYVAGWDAVIASRPRPEIVLVESYNEIAEGSHLMPSWPVNHAPGDGHWTGPGDDPVCLFKPCHPIEYTDTWSANPWHYMDLTRQKIREWLVGPIPAGVDITPPHAFIIWPKTDEGGGGAIQVRIVVGDDKAVRDVNLYLDGFLLLKTTGSIDRLLKTWYMTNGRHRLLVEVFDQAGNRDVDQSDFIVQNPWVAPAVTAVAGAGAFGSAGEVAPTRVRPPLCRQYDVRNTATSGAAPAWEIEEAMVPCLGGGTDAEGTWDKG